MGEVRAAQTPLRKREDQEREAFMAAVEDGLADLDAGRVHTHDEVKAEMRRRFSSPSK